MFTLNGINETILKYVTEEIEQTAKITGEIVEDKIKEVPNPRYLSEDKRKIYVPQYTYEELVLE